MKRAVVITMQTWRIHGQISLAGVYVPDYNIYWNDSIATPTIDELRAIELNASQDVGPYSHFGMSKQHTNVRMIRLTLHPRNDMFVARAWKDGIMVSECNVTIEDVASFIGSEEIHRLYEWIDTVLDNWSPGSEFSRQMQDRILAHRRMAA